MYGMDEKDFDRNATQAVEHYARAEFLRAHYIHPSLNR